MERFTKRGGTVNKGNNYENLNVANIVLKLADEERIKKFYLSLNDKTFGDFDDIVVEVETQHGTETYAMQLKHKDKTKSTLSIQQLKHERGDFSIQRYFKTVESLSCASIKFILYTNLKLNVGPGTRFKLNGENFEMELLRFYPNDAFKISDKTDSCYKFRIVDDCSESPKLLEYKEFFENFFLYDNQENNDNLKVSLREKFKRMFLVSEAEFDQYLKVIFEWCMQTGKIEKIDKKWMRRTIALQILATRIKPLSFGPVSEKMKLFRQIIGDFNVTIVPLDSYDEIKVLWGDINTEIKNEKVTQQLRKKYQLGSTPPDSSVDLDCRMWSTLLWLMGKCPLIVTEDETVSKAIQLCPEEKFILLGEGSSDLANSSVFKHLSDLKQHDHYDSLTKNLTCSVQGKGEMTLEMLVQENQDFLTLVKVDHLLQMLIGTYNFGGEMEMLPEPYISRCLLETVIDLKFLEKNGKDNLIIVDNVKKIEEIKSKFKYHHFINVDGFVKDEDNIDGNYYAFTNMARSTILERSNLSSTIFYSRNKCLNSEFQKICAKNGAIRNCHQFRVRDDGNLRWIQSKGDLSDLENYKLPDPCPVEEKLLWTSEPENKLNVILADPGMGKSELMRSLKNSTLSKFWTVIIYPKDTYAFFKTSQKECAEEFERFLVHEKYAELKERDKDIFRAYMRLNQVIYVWDAIDEIPSNCLEIVTNIILEFFEKGRIQWVTSRCHLKKKLETKFSVLSRILSRFGQEEQVFYIEKRLVGISSETIEEVINKIRSTFVLVEHKDILGIPLQIFMLTELFRQNKDKYLGLLTNAFTLSDLYSHFIEEKFNIYYAEKMGIDYRSLHLELLVKTFQRDMTESYETVALKTVFSDEIVQKLNINCDKDLRKVEEGYASIGLVTEFPNQIPRFVHISFAEYFVAVYISKNLTLKETLADIIFDYKFANVRFFLDLMLANKSPPHVAVLYKNFSLLKDYEEDIPTSKDDGGRSVLHLACSWGQRHPRLQVQFFSKAGRYNVHDKIPVNLVAESEDYWNMMDYLLEKCSVTEEDNLFGMTPLSYAQKAECLAAEIKILQKQGVNFIETDEETQVSHAINILYYSARFGYSEAIDLFVHYSISKVGNLPFFNIINISGRSLLYMASRNGHIKIVKSLVTFGAKINYAYRNVAIPLIAAAKNGHLQVVKFLLSSGADPNRQNYMGATPLFMASLNGHYEVVEFLVTSNASVDLSDCDGNGPLFVASFSGHLQIVKLLLQSGSKIASTNNDGATALFIACQVGYFEIVEFLVKFGAEVNSANHKGASPLLIASQNGHENIVNSLVSFGAEVNRATDEGATPLLVACQNGHLQVAKSLVASGADFNLSMVDGATPLFVACQNGHEDIAEFLIVSGVSITQKQGSASLLVACYNGHDGIVKLLAKASVNLNNSDLRGVTPLVLASYHCHDKIVDSLIPCGANVNCATNQGTTALHVACHEGHDKLLKILLRTGAEVNAVNDSGATPLFLASQNGHEEIVDVLLASGADSNLATNQGATPLFVASQNGHVNIVKSLVKSDSDIDLSTQDGITPFFISCQNGYGNIAKFLFSSGANLNCTLYDGVTPLIAVCRDGNVQISQLLVVLGADPNLSSLSGDTPLFLASSGGHTTIVKLLVEAHADVNHANKKGVTALFIASTKGYNEIVDFLIESGGSVNLATNAGVSPLFVACQNDHLEVVKSLVVAGAQVNLPLPLSNHYKVDEFFNIDDLSRSKVIKKLRRFAKGHSRIVEFLMESDVVINFGRDKYCIVFSALLDNKSEKLRLSLEIPSTSLKTDKVSNSCCVPF